MKLCGGDAYHTWDFDENRPLVCSKELFPDDYKNFRQAMKNAKKNSS